MRKLHYNEEHHRRSSNYLWLLAALFMLLFFPIFSVFFQSYTDIVFKLCITFVILMGAYVVTQNKKELVICAVLGLIALLGLWLDDLVFEPNRDLTIFRTVSGIAYFTYLGKHISVQLIKSKNQVNLNLVYGAIICYLIIGVAGGQLSTLMDLAIPGTFFEYSDSIDTYKYYYFSFATLSTLGYGDITPTNESGRALSLLIALFGQIYLTIIMAIIIGKFLKEGEGKP